MPWEATPLRQPGPSGTGKWRRSARDREVVGATAPDRGSLYWTLAPQREEKEGNRRRSAGAVQDPVRRVLLLNSRGECNERYIT